MNLFFIIIIIIIIISIVSISLSIFHITNNNYSSSPSPGPPSPDYKSIMDKYNNITYDPDGKPNGGFLITMFNTKMFLPMYTSRVLTQNDCATFNEIVQNFDIGNINNLLKEISDTGARTNCYSLDTTYFRRDLPNYAFGPAGSSGNPPEDFVIGLILDIDKLWDYIACMYVIDSGSIARYNENEPTDASWWTGPKTKIDWNKFLNDENSKNLGMCGCGKFSGTPSMRGLNTHASLFIVNTDDNAIKLKNNIKTINNVSDLITPSYWSFNNNKNIPFSKYQWKHFAESAKYIYNYSNNIDYTNVQCLSNSAGDGYRENEVDIIIPNNSKNSNCDVIDDFKNKFVDSILGIFTNANTNCSNKIIGANSCLNCEQTSSYKCCCNTKLHENIVTNLVNTFNKKHKKNISGYTLDTINILNFNKNIDLNLKLIKE